MAVEETANEDTVKEDVAVEETANEDTIKQDIAKNQGLFADRRSTSLDSETTISSDDDFERSSDNQLWAPDNLDKPFTDSDSQTSSVAGNLRIENDKLLNLLNTSGELGLLRGQLQSTLDATREDLEALRINMDSMREGLRDIELEADAQIRSLPENQMVSDDHEFDPLQLDRYSRLQAKSREVTEVIERLAKVERDLETRASDIDGAIQHQHHLGDQLQTDLMSARMVSVGEYLPRLRYLVRETAKRYDKQINLVFTGIDIEVDRQVMDAMMAPFEHMIRNSVVHGIETTAQRIAENKSETGVITIAASQQGTDLVVAFSDDGQGLDVERLSERAVQLGLIEDTDSVSSVDLLHVITQSGYSTSDTVSMEAGRGVGMDVVYQAVRDLGGSMVLTNSPGTGVSFQFRLPVTLTMAQALLIRVGTWRFAIRSRMIERLVRVPYTDIVERQGEIQTLIDGEYYSNINVHERLGLQPNRDSSSMSSMVLVRLTDRLAVLEVDEFEDSVNIVGKNLGTQLASVAEVSGVTVLPDSSIILVLDLEAFVERVAAIDVAKSNDSAPPLAQAAKQAILRRVLVVDDSLVVRKVMQKDLESTGLKVETAVDGVNALELLEHGQFDMALVDIEMPRMNGYELLERLRADERYIGLPVIIITSRSGEQHRQRALSLGADEYISKPYDITALNQLMRSVIANRNSIQ